MEDSTGEINSKRVSRSGDARIDAIHQNEIIFPKNVSWGNSRSFRYRVALRTGVGASSALVIAIA